MDFDVKVCRCVVVKRDSSGRGQECMGPGTRTTGANETLQREDAPDKSLGVHRLSLAPARRRANRLPIIPPQRIGQETGRDIASRSACGKSKRLRRKRAPARQYTRSQNKCDRGNFNVPTTSPGLSCLDPLPSKNQGPAVGEPLFARDTLGGTLNDNRSERGSCLSEGSGRSVSAGSLRSTADSLDSVDSMNSLGTCSFPTEVFPLSDASFSETDRDTAFAADGQVGRLGVVDRTLFDSWKELPWQARLCPRAIEEQEDIRRASARKEEGCRVQAWRQEQQILASNAAGEEERRLSVWWKGEAEKLWDHESERRRSHAELAAHHEVQLTELEHQRTELLSVGYERELAAVERMELLEHAERQGKIGAVFEQFCRSVGEDSEAEMSPPGTPVAQDPSETPDEKAGTQEKKDKDDSMAQISTQAKMELERVKRHASALAETARVYCRRRENLAYLTYRGLEALYGDTKARARRTFVFECAADVAQVKQLASVGQASPSREPGSPRSSDGGVEGHHEVGAEIGLDEAWLRERRRATGEIRSEISRVARRARLQRAVLRRSTGEVLRLLTIDSLRRAPVEGGGRWSGGCIEEGARGGGGAESMDVVRKRARRALSELRTRQAGACLEADSVQQAWMAALAHWKTQLGRARVMAVKGEVTELRIVQKEEAEVLKAREATFITSLQRRSEALAKSWKDVFEVESRHVSDAVESWRHCFLLACDKLKELIKDSRLERIRMSESWKDQRAIGLDRSRAIAELIDGAQEQLEQEQSSLAVELTKIVGDITTAEVKAVLLARRDWWDEAKKGLVCLLMSELAGVTNRQGGAGGCRENQPSAAESPLEAGEESNSSAQLLARLDGLTRVEGLRSAGDAVAIVAEGGPLHLAVAEKQLRSRETMERCASALEAALEAASSRSRSGSSLTAEAAATGAVGDAHFEPVADQLGHFRLRLEADAVEFATASFECEVRELALDGNGEQNTSSLRDSPSELSRSQLDLRRAERARDCARALGEMLSRARDVLLKKAREEAKLDEDESRRNVVMATSRHTRRVSRLKECARVDSDEALMAALAEVGNRAQRFSTKSRAATGLRRRVIQLASRWVDDAVRSELKRNERRLHAQQEQQTAGTSSLTELKHSLAREQREWIQRIREGGQDALESAQTIVAGYFEETVRQKRQRGGKAVDARKHSSGSNAARSAAGQRGSHIDGRAANDPTPPSSLEETKVQALALLAAAEGSLAVGVDSWTENARSRARAWAQALLSDAASTDSTETRTTEAEREAVELAFHAAREEATQTLSLEQMPDSPTARSGGRGGGSSRAEGAGEGPENTAGGGASLRKPVPDYVAGERQECTRLWSGLQQALVRQPELDDRRPPGAGLQEDARDLGDRAMAHVADLELELRRVLGEAATRGKATVEQAMISAGGERK